MKMETTMMVMAWVAVSANKKLDPSLTHLQHVAREEDQLGRAQREERVVAGDLGALGSGGFVLPTDLEEGRQQGLGGVAQRNGKWAEMVWCEQGQKQKERLLTRMMK
jgi:hypothetical protein